MNALCPKMNTRMIKAIAMTLGLVGASSFAADAAQSQPRQRPYILSELNKTGIPPLLDHIDTPEKWAR